MKRRILSALTALALVLTMCPLGAFAADTGGDDEVIFITKPLEGEMFTMETEPVLPSSFFNLERWSEPNGFTNNIYEGYRNQLEEDAKTVYDNMKTAFAEPQASITVNLNHTFENITATGTKNDKNEIELSLTQETNDQISAYLAENVTAAYLALKRDHPEMPWLAAEKFGVGTYNYAIDQDSLKESGSGTYTLNITIASVPFELTNVPTEISNGKATFESEVNTVVSNLTSSINAADSDYAKVKIIHDNVCTMITYDKTTESPYNQTAYSAFIGKKTVCAGYGTSFKLLCDKFGIPCVYVSGVGGITAKENHGWNYVKIENDGWYAVDCTWDDQSEIRNDFFLVGKNTVASEIWQNGVGGTKFSDNHVSDGAWSSNKTIVFPYPTLSDEKCENTNKQNPTYTVPTNLTATYGQKLSDIVFTNPANGTWSWADNTKDVGNVGNNQFDATFTPNDTDTYNTVTEKITVKVNPKDLSDSTVTVTVDTSKDWTYTGSPLTPAVTVKDGETVLVKDTDYTVAYDKNIDAGTNTAEAKVTGKGNYTGEKTATFTIKKGTATLTITPKSITYDGEPVVCKKSDAADANTADIIYEYDGDATITDANIKWYEANGTTELKDLTPAQEAPPRNAGTYQVGVSADAGTNTDAVDEVKEEFTIKPVEHQFVYNHTNTNVTVNTPYPTDATVTLDGLKTDKVSGDLKWYTDSQCNQPASGNFNPQMGENQEKANVRLYWEFTPKNANYTGTTKGQTDFIVSKYPPQTITFTQEGTIEQEYGTNNNTFTNAATSKLDDNSKGGDIIYSSENPDIATVDENGVVTIKKVGEVKITATAGVVTGYSETSKYYTLKVTPKTITVSIAFESGEPNPEIVYTGSAIEPAITVTVADPNSAINLVKDTDYKVKYNNNTNVGNANVSIEPVEGSNYSWTAPAALAFTITKAEYSGMKTGTSSANAGTNGTFDLSTLSLPAGSTITVDALTADSILESAALSGTDKIQYKVKSTATVGQTGTITANVTNANYQDFTITITVTVSNLQTQAITFPAAEVKKIYGDADFTQAINADTTGRTITYTSSDTAVATVTNAGVVHIVKPGTVTITATAAANQTYAAATASYNLVIDKATVTITAANKSAYVGDSAPALGSGDYTITGLVNGETLGGTVNIAYASTPDMSRAGTVSIVVSGGTVPNTDNYNETIQYVNGTLTISTRTSGGNTSSSGGGGGKRPSSSSSTPTKTTTTNPQTGATVETTKNPDGSRTQVTTETDGTVSTRITDSTGSVTCEVSIPSGVHEKSLPISSLRATKDSANAPTLTIFAQSDVKVKVPVSNLAPGVVAVVIGANGQQEILKTSVPETDGLSFTAHGDTTIKIVDNSKTFADVNASDWHKKAVDFASARGLFNGTSETTFSPESPMTRGMLAMVLHNLEDNPPAASNIFFPDVAAGAWYADAVRWASAKGIISGYDNGQVGAEDDISREQLAVILWRYAGSPAASGTTLNFSDAAMASDYAKSALSWATEVGIISGTGNGALSPKAQASRAQVAQMLKNFITVMN